MIARESATAGLARPGAARAERLAAARVAAGIEVRKRRARLPRRVDNAGMLLDTERCYRALATHDRRFDGRVFVGVTTTRIYCRPVCTARPPRKEHCRFFPTAAAAEAQGFRPCLRCRPELAPGHARVDAVRGAAIRAAGLIEDGVLHDGAGLGALAARLGVTDRHLRRVFRDEFGVSPVEFAQTQRLLLAKRLLTDTSLPVIDVAMASGFASLRRFNALFRARYRLSPTGLRRRADTAEADGFRFVLRFQPPYDWDAMLRFLGQRALHRVEEVGRGRYRRTVRLPARGTSHVGWVEVSRSSSRDGLDVLVAPSLSRVLPAVVARVKRLFDVACPIGEIRAALGALAGGRPGLRVPGAFDGFELAVRAVLGQQVTVTAARTLASRFVGAFGEPVDGGEALDRLFPLPERIAALDPGDIAALGIVAVRARAIVTLAQQLSSGALVLEPDVDVPAAMAALTRIEGIGEWTAEYIAMRALSWPDAFPASDAGVRQALRETSPARIRARAEAWRPWRAYAVMHLWHGAGEGRGRDCNQLLVVSSQ